MIILIKLLIFLKLLNCQNEKPIIRKYLFYDVNPSEGFNLRRDVYIRMANLVKSLNENKNSPNQIVVWTLILPPWSHLYHWKSGEIINQEKLKWSEFFHLPTLQTYIPVLELEDYIKLNSANTHNNWNHIDIVYYLQNYKQQIQTSNWIEKADLDIEKCNEMEFNYYLTNESKYKGYFWSYHDDFYTTRMHCVSYQGTIKLMENKFLQNNQFNKIMLDRAETMLHEHYGQLEYWQARASMRYALHLEEKANELRSIYNLTSQNQYLGVHLRRADFVRVRQANLVSIDNVVRQLVYYCVKLNLKLIYLATDTTREEKNELENKLNQYKLIYFEPNENDLKLFKDGGIAIIDQIMCAYAYYFIGTYESTFSFRIQEDRELLGIHDSDTTFNRFCFETNRNECKSTKWFIKH